MEIKPCSSLDEIRVEIDRINQQLVLLLVERAGYVQQVARFKRTEHEVVDPARVEKVVANARANAITCDGDPDLIEKIFRAMIKIYTDFEQDELKKLQKG